MKLILLRFYNKPGMDYYQYSEQRKKEGKLNDEEYARQMINNDVELIDLLLDTIRFTKGDFEVLFGFDRQRTNEIINKLFKMRALRKRGTTYVKTGAFIGFLKMYKKELETKKEEDII